MKKLSEKIRQHYKDNVEIFENSNRFEKDYKDLIFRLNFYVKYDGITYLDHNVGMYESSTKYICKFNEIGYENFKSNDYNAMAALTDSVIKYLPMYDCNSDRMGGDLSKICIDRLKSKIADNGLKKMY